MMIRKNFYSIVFFILAGFLLGISLFFAAVIPIEALMAKKGLAQNLINTAMTFMIIFWVIISVVFTYYFHRKTVKDVKKKTLARNINIVLLIACSGIFYSLLTTDNLALKQVRSTLLETKFGYTFGPYPDEIEIENLKESGYEGIVTLLSPTIPFEKILLEKEIKTAKRLGMKIYSIPMLPWISGNEEAITKLKEISRKDKNRLYIHCYLGRHRVKIAKLIIEGELAKVSNNTSNIYPDKLERGNLSYHRGGNIILGPYPSDEEWFSLVLRGQVKEVVSYLDWKDNDDAHLLKKEQEICKNMGLKFKSLPVRKNEKNLSGIKELAEYVKNSKEKIFVHGFRNDKTLELLNEFLGFGALAKQNAPVPLKISTGNVVKISDNLALGPKPSGTDLQNLKASGFTNIESKSFTADKKPAFVANQLFDYFDKNAGVYYIYGFNSEAESSAVAKILRNRLFGIPKTDLPDKISGNKIEKFNRRITIGVLPSPEELEKLAKSGIRTMIFLRGRDNKTDEEIDDIRKQIEITGMYFQVLDYKEGYDNEIVEESFKEDDPFYLIVPPGAKYQIIQQLTDIKLY